VSAPNTLRSLYTLTLLLGLAPAAAGAEPTFQAPPGFVVEKVAGPPLVRYPLFACFDDRGRLFVAEGTGTNLSGAELAKRKLGRLILLEDTDGDGRFDTSTVFADELVFPQGVLWHDGAVYTMSHPSLWKLEDPDGKGVATRRTELVTKFNFNGNGCDIHGPFLGPDGRLYWTDGRHGYQVRTREGAVLEGLASRIWRCRLDGRDIERLCGGGFDNPVELAWTPDGEMLGTMDQGPGDMLLHYVEGGVYPMEHPCLREFVRTGPLLGGVRQYSAALPAALCGLTRYRADRLGPEYRNALFSTHYMVHKVVRHTLVRDGSTFRAEDTDFVTSNDHDVRLTDVLEDADGSLLFIDMGSWFTYGFPGNPIPKPEALGGVYRVRRKDAPKIDDPWGRKLNLATLTPAQLTPLLQDRRPAVRDAAIRQLARHGPTAVPELRQTLRKSSADTVQARRNAVWALCRIAGAEARAALRTALQDPDAGVRSAAAHGVGLDRDAAAVEALSRLVRSDEPPVRRRAAEALGRIGKPAGVPALLDGLRQGGDRFLEHSLIYALIQIGDRGATLPALEDSRPQVRRAALIALEQMKEGGLVEADVVRVLASEDVGLQIAALDVLSRRPAWAGKAAVVLRRWFTAGRLSPEQEQAVRSLVAASSAEPAVQDVVAEALRERRTSSAIHIALIEALAQSRAEKLPARWLEALATLLKHDEIAVRRHVLAAIRTRNLAELDPQVAELGRDARQPPEIRIAAIECWSRRHPKLEADFFGVLAGQITEKAEPLDRLAAARALAAGTLSREQLLELVGKLRAANTQALRALLPLFSRGSDPTVGAALAEALNEAPGAEALSVAQLDQVLAGYPAAVKARASRLRAKLVERQKGQAAYLARIAAELEPLRGDADAGQEIFLSQKAACYSCHRAVGRGGTVGPDLSKIGRFRSRAELLESLVFPSLTIAPEYRSVRVARKDGKVHEGLILADTPGAIVLRTMDLAEVRIGRADIEEVTPSNISLMPEGLEKTMSRQELRNLLEFLVHQR
jgi:putative heme-binding domain-containing protein